MTESMTTLFQWEKTHLNVPENPSGLLDITGIKPYVRVIMPAYIQSNAAKADQFNKDDVYRVALALLDHTPDLIYHVTRIGPWSESVIKALHLFGILVKVDGAALTDDMLGADAVCIILQVNGGEPFVHSFKFAPTDRQSDFATLVTNKRKHIQNVFSFTQESKRKL